MSEVGESGRRRALRWAVAASVGALLLVPRTTFAQSAIERTGQRLKFVPDARTDDFRVRTNAALALGQSNDDAAVPHLCRGLADPNETVRLAVVAGLRKLNRAAAAECVKRRVPDEKSVTVKEQLEQLSGVLSKVDEKFVPREVPDAKVYVALAKVENKTGRPEVEKLVLGTLRTKLDSLNLQLAPPDESPKDAAKVLKARGLKGYYLSVVVDAFDYSPAGLKAKVNVAVATYPGKDIKGSFSPTASMGGISAPNSRSENQLVEALSSNVAQKFADNFK